MEHRGNGNAVGGHLYIIVTVAADADGSAVDLPAVEYIALFLGRDEPYKSAGRVAAASAASGDRQCVGGVDGAGCPNGGQLAADVGDGAVCYAAAVGGLPVIEVIARAGDRRQGAVWLVLAEYRDAVSVCEGASVGVEYRVYEMGVFSAVIAVEEDLGLVYAPFDKSGKYLAIGGAEHAEGIGDLLVGQRIAV